MTGDLPPLAPGDTTFIVLAARPGGAVPSLQTRRLGAGQYTIKAVRGDKTADYAWNGWSGEVVGPDANGKFAKGWMSHFRLWLSETDTTVVVGDGTRHRTPESAVGAAKPYGFTLKNASLMTVFTISGGAQDDFGGLVLALSRSA